MGDIVGGGTRKVKVFEPHDSRDRVELKGADVK